MNIDEMNIDQVEARMAELSTMLNSPEADLDAISTETEKLKARKAKLKADHQKRQALLQDIANNNEAIQTLVPENTGRSSMEYRQAFMDYVVTGKKSNVLESRAADQIESTDLGVLLPETIIQEIMTDLDGVYGTLYTKVKKTNIKGGVKYPIGAFDATFKRITELAVSERQAAGGVTGYVQFGYNIGEIRIARTLLQSILTVDAFEKEVAKVIVKAYVKAMDYEIMTGDPANNECEGILTEYAKSTSRIKSDRVITMTPSDVADWAKWEEKLFAEIPLAMEGESPEFVFAKQTYVANLVTLQDANGQPIKKAGYDVTDRQHKFNEYPVLRVEKDILPDFNSANTGDVFGMFWVPSKAYAINSNMEFTVVHYFDHETNQYVDKALVVNDGKILNPDYLYLLVKGS